jgi:ergothioneine biosynthesis protein EgtB
VNSPGVNLSQQYLEIRQQSLDICGPLQIEDYGVQPMADASPPRWHLAHTTWFFETFILKPSVKTYQSFDDAFEVLFNSYYNGVGEQFPRHRRGALSRPTVAEVVAYRRHVDRHMVTLLADTISDETRFRVILGLNHEQQHQELIFTDLKYNLGNNPLHPKYKECRELPAATPTPLRFTSFAGGTYAIGDTGSGFAFDNERPRHDVLIGDFELANRLITNAEFQRFVEDDGYSRPEFWLSDGWAMLREMGEQRWQCPLYWRHRDDNWFEYTLSGLKSLDPQLPVSHVSAYEADAFARWQGARLPTEMEWEVVAQQFPVAGNFQDSGYFHATPASSAEFDGLHGNLWQWTQSSYSSYPGFRPFAGALGEYNGKFMANQLVLRGGSCVTPRSHIRSSYRNFFYPGDRWQFSGIRLARDKE